MKDPFNVIITGVGGQGNVLASQILGQCLVQEGFKITIGETYGASQRGGSVMSHVRISKTDQWSPIIPEGEADLVVGLEPMEALRVLDRYGTPQVAVVTNVRPIYPIGVIAGQDTYPPVSDILDKLTLLSSKLWTLNATELALEMGNVLYSNMIMLGALASMELPALPMKRESFAAVLKMLIKDSLVAKNMEAFDRGMTAVRAGKEALHV
ncbi:MAG: indolepyruvate oxidoreductase subunit beta [Desulfobacterales bacterium]|nr:indolepyruvate oxidoreductase subunit beta [Desulfobacterales bacterium]